MFNKVESAEHAFSIVGFTPDLKKFKKLGLPERYVQPLFDGFVLELVVEANNKINGDWKADWNNGKQRKFSVWNYVVKDESKPAGFGLADTGYAYWSSVTNVGERLLVGSSEQALYLGNEFKPLFESHQLIIRK
jgi:hypothetical protein